MPSKDDFHGVVELTRAQLAMQRELTALRAQKLVMTQRQTKNEHAAVKNLNFELQNSRAKIEMLSREVKRLDASLGQAHREAELLHQRQDALSTTLNDVYASWSWRIGQRAVSMANVIRHPFKRLKDGK